MKQKIKQLNAFTLAEGGHSPLLCGDEGTQGSPYLVKAAFTLAEVLITLGVIGVVAAVTMPTLVKNYQKKQTVTKLKKAYSELSQAMNIAQKDLGMFEDWDFANFPTQADSAKYFFENVLKPNLKIAKYCDTPPGECWAEKIVTLKGEAYDNIEANYYKSNSFQTASGYSVNYWIHANGMGGWFFVDLNGPKKPNILGKDIFTFKLNNQTRTYSKERLGLSPQGMYRYNEETKKIIPNSRDNIITAIDDFGNGVNGCSKSTTGLSCAALIMMDGWEIKDDYPW